MGFLFREKDKQLKFSVKGYEFSLNGGMDETDANWLTIEIEYEDSSGTYFYEDNCLLAYEMAEITAEIDKLLFTEETGILLEFTEPYFKLAVTQVGEIYAVQLRFVYDTAGGCWKERYISQGMNREELAECNDEIKKMCKAFPVRKGK